LAGRFRTVASRRLGLFEEQDACFVVRQHQGSR